MELNILRNIAAQDSKSSKPGGLVGKQFFEFAEKLRLASYIFGKTSKTSCFVEVLGQVFL